MEEAREAERGQDQREGQLRAEYGGAQVRTFDRDRVARTKNYFLESLDVRTESHFAVRAAVDVVEDGFGKAFLG
jgi:hypothetical protein